MTDLKDEGLEGLEDLKDGAPALHEFVNRYCHFNPRHYKTVYC